MFHWNGTIWEPVPIVSRDLVNNTITGEVSSLSIITLGFPSSPPTGTNTYPLLLLGLLAIAAGLVVTRKARFF